MVAVAQNGLYYLLTISTVVAIISVVTAIMQAMITVTILLTRQVMDRPLHTLDFAIFQFAEVLRDAVQLH